MSADDFGKCRLCESCVIGSWYCAQMIDEPAGFGQQVQHFMLKTEQHLKENAGGGEGGFKKAGPGTCGLESRKYVRGRKGGWGKAGGRGWGRWALGEGVTEQKR